MSSGGSTPAASTAPAVAVPTPAQTANMQFAQNLGSTIQGGFNAAGNALAQGGSGGRGVNPDMRGAAFQAPQMPTYGMDEEDLSGNFTKKKRSPFEGIQVGY